MCCAVVVAFGLLSGCSRAPERTAEATSQEAAAPAAAAADEAAMPAANELARSRAGAPAAEPTAESQLQSAAASQPDGERQFIRTAEAEFRVRDVYGSALAIEDLVAQHGGFVVKNDIRAQVDDVETRPSGDGNLVELATYTVRGQLQVRVPSARAQGFMRALAAQVEFLDSRTFAAMDAQFELLRQQLAFARHQDEQRALGEIAAGQGKVGEKAQAVEARTQSQSQRDEALIARKTFEDRVAFATIDLSLYQTPRVRRSVRMDVEAVMRHDGPGFFVRLGHALSAGWYGLLDTAIALSRLWPLWLLLAAGAWLLRRWRRR
jgi:hypothetical protein